MPSRTVVGPNSGMKRYGPCGDPPDREGGTEVQVAALDARIGGNVDEAAGADQGVEHHTAEIVACRVEPAPSKIPLTAENRSSMLWKTLLNAVRMNWGTTAT